MSYECLECGEVVPEGCCTCGPRQNLRPLSTKRSKMSKDDWIDFVMFLIGIALLLTVVATR